MVGQVALGRSPPSFHSRYKLFIFLPDISVKKTPTSMMSHFRTVSSHFLLLHEKSSDRNVTNS